MFNINNNLSLNINDVTKTEQPLRTFFNKLDTNANSGLKPISKGTFGNSVILEILE